MGIGCVSCGTGVGIAGFCITGCMIGTCGAACVRIGVVIGIGAGVGVCAVGTGCGKGAAGVSEVVGALALGALE